ncbi:MAG TPA: tetratricopeptide repeat protein [Caulobacteraceae bacterium]|nr:tetratricopeptide repeat protein [Caulobacteraceae bacterium]
MSSDPRAQAQSRLSRLNGYLESDPDNLSLIADAAVTARDAGDMERAQDLIERYASLAALPPSLENLRGLIAIDQRRFEEASGVFQGLLEQSPTDTAVRYNLAFARTMLRDFPAVADIIDDETVLAVPEAATLKVQALHQLGDVDQALTFGLACAVERPGDTALASALAVAALDAEQPDVARDFALRAGDTHEGLSTLGMLALTSNDVGGSLAYFDRALAVRSDSARARLGKGLALMARGDLAEAANDIDQAAAIFRTHLGTWVASGWAHFVQGDYKGARQAFETALDLDPSFAESQGSLAVVDAVEGRLDSARRRTEIALRLDRNCFSAAFAKSLLLGGAGDAEAAQRIIGLALQSPLADGQTLAQAMSGFARVLGPR